MVIVLQKIKAYWWQITLALLSAITVVSLYPHASLPAIPGTDKSHHLIAYAVLVFPTALRRPHRWRLIMLFFILCGGMIELIQPYVNRQGEWREMLANTSGVILGALLAHLVNGFYDSEK